MDDDDHGHVSLDELTRGLKYIRIRADRLAARLEMERDMSNMVLKLPNFCVCLACFLVAIYNFSPAAAVFRIHNHIDAHFEFSKARLVKDLAGIYWYMELFEWHNAEMQATSSKYWCEDRYHQHAWSEDLGVPRKGCPSPRLFSLGLLNDSSLAWSANSSNSTSSHRRLASSVASATTPVMPKCEDNDAQLQIEENSPNVTCASSALDHHHVCQHDLGILLCPKTCGYCSPFNYKQHHRFAKPQVTMLPTMVYQTRYPKIPCEGFAAVYEAQPHNPALVLLPALDGQRDGPVLTCIDRLGTLEAEYAHVLPCPADGPPAKCSGNVTRITHKHTFHGDVVYPELLMEPARDIKKMKEIEWIDLQTKVLTISTMVYTEHLEVFTSVSMDFTIDDAGNVVASPTVVSYRDLINGSRGRFISCLIVTCSGAFIGTILSVVFMWRNPEACKWGYQAYEFFSRATLLIYPVLLLVQWTQQVPMAKEYDFLLHTFLDMKDVSYASVDSSIQTFFDVKTEIYNETSWLKRQRIVAYVVCYIQFLQLIFYFNAHPKMAVLTATVRKALDQIFHFLLVFSALFLMLAFMAHWMVGEYIDEFGTLGQSIISQARMVFGEFIEAKKASELSGAMKTMYWVYACTFLLIVWMVLLNFILAIVVDAFIDVKKENKDRVYINNFLVDFYYTFSTTYWSWRHKWPSQTDVIHFLVEAIEAQGGMHKRKTISDVDSVGEDDESETIFDTKAIWTVDTKAFKERFSNLDTDEKAALYLHHFYLKCNSILLHYTPPEVRGLTGMAGLQGTTATEPARSEPVRRDAAGNVIPRTEMV